MENSYILVTDFDETVKVQLDSELANFRTVWFHFDSLLVEHIKLIFDEVYLTEEIQKYILIETKKLSNITQNSLLKLFEEPPKNINFILIVPTKSIVLPTVRSRLPVKVQDNKKAIDLNIDIPVLQTLNLVSLNAFLKSIKKFTPIQSRVLVEQIFASNKNFNFKPADLERFAIASQLLNLHSNSSRVLLMLLLPFANK